MSRRFEVFAHLLSCVSMPAPVLLKSEQGRSMSCSSVSTPQASPNSLASLSISCDPGPVLPKLESVLLSLLDRMEIVVSFKHDSGTEQASK